VNDGTADRAVTKLPGTQAAVPAARRFAHDTISARGINGDVLETAELLVTELTTNAVVHAHSPIRVSVLPHDHRIRVEVRDDDPTPLQPPCRPAADAEGGRGLWLVAALASSWGVNRNAKGKTVWFEVG
jgi:anti-sigma regulatory factor (Ser/Thr protein kinase)